MDAFEEDEALSDLEKKKQLELHRRKADLREVMSLPEGRRFLWRLIHHDAGLCERTYEGEATHASAYGEGKRSVGIALQVELTEGLPVQYLLMMQEQLERPQE